MMGNIEEIANALRKIQADSSTQAINLEREYGYMKNTHSKVLSVFGDQQAGQGLASSLFTAMERAYDAYCEMYSLSSDTGKMIQRLKR